MLFLWSRPRTESTGNLRQYSSSGQRSGGVWPDPLSAGTWSRTLPAFWRRSPPCDRPVKFQKLLCVQSGFWYEIILLKQYSKTNICNLFLLLAHEIWGMILCTISWQILFQITCACYLQGAGDLYYVAKKILQATFVTCSIFRVGLFL